jgi:uncharacterized RDD family membrane protein YckC
MLDTVRLVETPEGVALHLHPAGVMPRAAAWAVDLMIRVAATMLLLVLFGLLGQGGMGLSLLSMFVVYWLYPILFEVLRDGQTIGKRAIGLRVIHANGTPVGWLASIVRNLMRTVDMLPVLYGFGAVASLLDPQGRRLGDMVAGTLVIHAERAPAAAPVPLVPAVWPEQVLASEEKAAIVAFAERGPRLTPERQAELADLLVPLTRQRGASAVQRLYGIASALLGRQ